MLPCNKRGYQSHKAAKKMLKSVKLQTRTNARRNEREIYKCRFCGEWHLTSSIKRSKQ